MSSDIGPQNSNSPNSISENMNSIQTQAKMESDIGHIDEEIKEMKGDIKTNIEDIKGLHKDISKSFFIIIFMLIGVALIILFHWWRL